MYVTELKMKVKVLEQQLSKLILIPGKTPVGNRGGGSGLGIQTLQAKMLKEGNNLEVANEEFSQQLSVSARSHRHSSECSRQSNRSHHSRASAARQKKNKNVIIVDSSIETSKGQLDHSKEMTSSLENIAVEKPQDNSKPMDEQEAEAAAERKRQAKEQHEKEKRAKEEVQRKKEAYKKMKADSLLAESQKRAEEQAILDKIQKQLDQETKKKEAADKKAHVKEQLGKSNKALETGQKFQASLEAQKSKNTEQQEKATKSLSKLKNADKKKAPKTIEG